MRIIILWIKKETAKLQGVSPAFNGKQNRKNNQIGEVEGKGEMKDGESS